MMIGRHLAKTERTIYLLDVLNPTSLLHVNLYLQVQINIHIRGERTWGTEWKMYMTPFFLKICLDQTDSQKT